VEADHFKQISKILDELEAICKTAFAHESGPYGGLTEKNEGQKYCNTSFLAARLSSNEYRK
jgi:hypothetical protein